MNDECRMMSENFHHSSFITHHFQFPPDLPYRCRQHGDCCREDWNIPIDPVSLSRLKEILEANQESGDFFTMRSGETTFCRHQGACVFQDEEDRCTIHSRWGEEVKPLVCRQFPYLFIETPAGVTVGYSFVCRSVREEHCFRTGSSDDNKENVEAIYRYSLERDRRFHVFTAESPVRLDEQYTLSWRAYEELERALIDLLSMKKGTLATRLAAGHAFCNLLTLSLHEARLPPEQEEAAAVQLVQSLSADGFSRVMRIAESSKGAFGIGRFVRALFITADRINRSESPGRFMAVRWYLHALIHGGRPKISQARRQVLDQYALPYLRHILRRRGLALDTGALFGGDIRKRYANLIIIYSLLEHFYSGLVGAISPEEAASEAIRKVERDIVLHAGLRGRMTDRESAVDAGLPAVLLLVLDRAYVQKAFPKSMLG